jgi:hypothetical protein
MTGEYDGRPTNIGKDRVAEWTMGELIRQAIEELS